MADTYNGTTVTVTSKGRTTIPEEFRDKLHIDTPGRVRFVENETGGIVHQPSRVPIDPLAEGVEILGTCVVGNPP